MGIARNQDDMIAVNIIPPAACRENATVQAYKIKYKPRFSENEIELVAMLEFTPGQLPRVQKLLVGNRPVQANPKIIRELTAYRWTAVPVGEEAREIPNVARLWTFPGLYIAACEPRTTPAPLSRQLEQIQEKELLLFYTLKEWWKKNKHLGFEGALKEYRTYLHGYYTKVRELKEEGRRIVVRVADVEAMKAFIASRGLPGDDPRSWRSAGLAMKEISGALWEEFPPLGPAGVIEEEFSAYISFHSYDVTSGNITYISVLIESGDSVINQYLVWNTGLNDLIDDMDAVRKKLREYGVTRRQFHYELMPMFGGG
ncbi:MAG: hypothetical protein K6T80_06885 [Firmicutes bacterium]|nr:hypothetical protein [Bacillota bacterium]